MKVDDRIVPRCSKCNKKMSKAKKGNYHYWTCLGNCRFITPVFSKIRELTKKEKEFFKDLKN